VEAGEELSGVEILPLELSSRISVREFAANVVKQLGDSYIDIFILNAGMRGSDAEKRSVDGYGLTFAVNHFLLSRSGFSPNLIKSSWMRSLMMKD